MTTHDDGQAEAVAMPFATILQMLNHGELHDELTDRFRELLSDCRDRQHKGKFTLALTVKPSGDMVTIASNVKVDTPEPERDPSLFYFDAHANPAKEDPRQSRLPLHAAPEPSREAQRPPTREVRVAGEDQQ